MCFPYFLSLVVAVVSPSIAASSVIPAKAGIQGRRSRLLPWIPAFAGMTEEKIHTLP